MLKKLTFRLLQLLFATAVLCAVIFWLLPPKPDNYMYALKDKHLRLSGLKGPKLIIIGGSNTAFGIDSEMLEKELGIPVVNMGIHVGLGLEYMLNEIKPDIGQGDVVVLLPEYTHFFNNVKSGFTHAFYRANEVYPQAIKFIKPDKIASSLVHTYTDLLQTKLKTLLISTGVEENKHVIRNKFVYRRQSFNRWGDMTAHLGMKNQEFEKNDDTFEQFKGLAVSGDFFMLTNDFDGFSTAKNAKFMLAFSPTPESVFLKKVGEEIAGNLKLKANYTILGQPKDCVYPDSLFFDTRYHLVTKSREDRTKQLIQYLKSNDSDIR